MPASIGNIATPAVKIDNNTLQVSTTPDAPAPVVQTYDYDFLLSQRTQIIFDANIYLAARQTELDTVNNLISQADALGITSKVMPQPLVDPAQQASPAQPAQGA